MPGRHFIDGATIRSSCCRADRTRRGRHGASASRRPAARAGRPARSELGWCGRLSRHRRRGRQVPGQGIRPEIALIHRQPRSDRIPAPPADYVVVGRRWKYAPPPRVLFEAVVNDRQRWLSLLTGETQPAVALPGDLTLYS
jgi:hypothetical protein